MQERQAPDPYFDPDNLRAMVRRWAIDCGRRVSETRKLRGYDRARLAALVGTGVPTIFRIETGTLNPRDHMKLAIAAALVVEVEDLWPFPRRQTVFQEAGAA